MRASIKSRLHQLRFLARSVAARAWPGNEKDAASTACRHFSHQRIAGYRDYLERARIMAPEFERRAALERELAAAGAAITTPGYCCVCRRAVSFHSDLAYGFRAADGKLTPNWRERVVCPVCRLNNRMRAAIHFFVDTCHPATNSAIYLTEQTTPLFAWLREHYPNAVGSEYLGDNVPLGRANAAGIRNESLTRLSFSDAAFDFILSFDVFEHVPDYRAAFRECLRCLKPRGALVFSVPFSHGSEQNIVRAEVAPDGTIVHHLPPEYHGDPINPAGCLCFYHFGWALLEDLSEIGYQDAAAYFYWSRELGYLGGDQLLFMAST